MCDPVAEACAVVSDIPLISKSTLHMVVLLPVPPGQFPVEVKHSLLLPALEEGGCDFPAQAASVGFQEHGGVEDAEEQPHNEQHRGVGRRGGADPAVGRAEDQMMVVGPVEVPEL